MEKSQEDRNSTSGSPSGSKPAISWQASRNEWLNAVSRRSLAIAVKPISASVSSDNAASRSPALLQLSKCWRMASGSNDSRKGSPRALQPGRSVKARGSLLLSPPGCGKSAFCRSLGNEVGRPVLTLDIGTLMGGLVGDTERNVRQALKIADAMSPCILFVDELEKGLSGVGGSGDSGVSTRLFGTLLSWLADHESDVFFIGTANDISRLPPEFTRAERLDAVFFLDLPGAAERQTIWQLYRRLYDIPANQPIPADTDWTGAEIKSCCRLSTLLEISLTEAATNVVPVAHTAAESLAKLRQWASGRCLSADRPGLYIHQANSPDGPRRKIRRDSSLN